MQLARAVLWHSIIILTQPTYYAYRWYRNPSYFSTASASWLTVGAVFWIFWLTRIAIPALTSPHHHLPTPDGEYFPFGHALTIRDKPTPDRILQAARETQNDGIMAFWQIFYLETRLIVTNPDTAMEVLNNHNYDYEKPGPAKKLLGRVLGEGLVNVEGNVHKAMRRSVAPAFSGRNIRDLVPIFWSKGLEVAQSMFREAQTSADGEVEVSNQMSRVTLDIIGAAGAGIDLNTVANDDNKLAQLYETITSPNRGPIILFFLINVLLPPWIVRRLYGTVYARVAKATDELRVEIRKILHDKKEAMALKTAVQKDIIATIMRSGDFSDEYLCNQLLTFFAAGHDTTASALTWCTWLLSKHQDVQDRLRKECQQHLSGLTPEQATADVFDNMPYLSAVCSETLRVYPTVPLTARHAVVNTKIGVTPVPKGTAVIISPWILNRSLDLWGDDAETFRPERWIEGPSPSTGNATSPYAFSTFIHGPRSCIGQSFSRQEMKCLLAALMLKFRVEPSTTQPHVEIGGFVTIKPKGGMRLKLIDIENEK